MLSPDWAWDTRQQGSPFHVDQWVGKDWAYRRHLLGVSFCHTSHTAHQGPLQPLPSGCIQTPSTSQHPLLSYRYPHQDPCRSPCLHPACLESVLNSTGRGIPFVSPTVARYWVGQKVCSSFSYHLMEKPKGSVCPTQYKIRPAVYEIWQIYTFMQALTKWSSKNMNQIMTLGWLLNQLERKPAACWGWQKLVIWAPLPVP